MLASIAIRSPFLIGELLLGKFGKTVVVHGNAPHNRPRCLVGHLIGNRASFLGSEAPMLRIPDECSGWHSQDSTRSCLNDDTALPQPDLTKSRPEALSALVHL